MVTTLIAQIVRSARRNIQVYDLRVVDLYQRVCARYLVVVKGAKQRQSAVKLGPRPNFRTDHAGFPNPVPTEAIRASTRKVSACWAYLGPTNMVELMQRFRRDRIRTMRLVILSVTSRIILMALTTIPFISHSLAQDEPSQQLRPNGRHIGPGPTNPYSAPVAPGFQQSQQPTTDRQRQCQICISPYNCSPDYELCVKRCNQHIGDTGYPYGICNRDCVVHANQCQINATNVCASVCKY
jgi:hypothetical protein